MSNVSEVVFVYIGDSLPDYAIASIKLASLTSGLSVLVLGNASIEKQVPDGVTRFVPVEKFYDPKHFLSAGKRVIMPAGFRSGFWLKTLERFFVLEQYMSTYAVHQIFHAELDQILFNCNELLSQIEKTGRKGMFLPFHTPDKIIASVFYCNEINDLKSFTEFAQIAKPFESEMNLFATYNSLNSGKITFLPTAATEKFTELQLKDFDILGSDRLGGIVDAAQLGQWIAGEDPRNVSIFVRPKNKYFEKDDRYLLSSSQLQNLSFTWSRESRLSYGEKQGASQNVYNLHLHSKIHRWLIKSDTNFDLLIKRSNEIVAKTIPTTRLFQIRNYVLLLIKLLLKNPIRVYDALIRICAYNIYRYFQLRPSSRPYISGDTFRKFADIVWEKNNDYPNLESFFPGAIVFCESDLVADLNEQILSKLKFKIVLLLGNSDKNHGKELNTVADRNFASSIFAQNLTCKIKGVEPIPIGLENAWLANNGKVLAFKILRLIRKRKFNRIMWSFTVWTNLPVRTEAINSLVDVETADNLGILTSREHRQELAKYKFAVCPPGNGLDTHRSWEAMYLRTVPIVLKSHMTEKFYEMGLPLWVVESYEELQIFTEADLHIKYEELAPRFNTRSLWFEFWREKIIKSKVSDFSPSEPT
jgi:hypothetical protein